MNTTDEPGPVISIACWFADATERRDEHAVGEVARR